MEPDPDLAEFAAARNREYGLTPIPSPRDEQLGRVIDQILDGSRELAELRDRLPRDSADTLMAYAERMASLAVRRRDSRLVQSALCALGLIGPIADVRDLILVIAVIYDAAQRLTGAPTSSVAALNQCEGTPALEQWVAFTNRLPKDQALSGFGYELSRDADGVRYRRNW